MKAKTRKYILNTTNPAPSTGAMLETYLKEKRIYQSALCRLLNRHPSAITSFRKQTTMQTAVLWEICHALQHNFFADIAAQLPENYTTKNESIKETTSPEISELQAEIATLKVERDTLRNMLEAWMKMGIK